MLSNPQALDTAVGAIRLRCYLHDNVSERKFLFLPWLYDQRERDLIAKQLPENGVFVDIGANAGIHPLGLSVPDRARHGHRHRTKSNGF